MITKRIKQKTVVEQVMEEIKNLIASGRYRVNDKIPTEAELGEMFGVSRPTIREAIKIFNYLGVLDSQSGKGTFVSDRANISTDALTWSLLLGNDELAELLELREALETRALKILTSAYRNRDADAVAAIAKMEQTLDRMQAAVDETEMEALRVTDYEFHLQVMSGSRNNIFREIYGTLQSFMLEEMHRTHQHADDLNYIVREHRDILDSIKSGDIDNVITAYEAHMNSRCFAEIRMKKTQRAVVSGR